MKNAFVMTAILLLVACGSIGPTKLTPEQQAAAEKPLICSTPEQCALYWERAQFYVNSNSRYKIQTINDNLIQTFSPTGGTTNLGYSISREPLGNSSYRIWVRVWCDNMFGCLPDAKEEIISFKSYVGK